MEDRVEYKYICLEKAVSVSRKTSVWNCHSQMGEFLGVVKWFGRWRQYSFYPGVETVFNVGCMADISDFIGKLMAERREKKHGD